MKILDTVHIWYILSLVVLPSMQEDEDVHVQIRVYMEKQKQYFKSAQHSP